MKNIYAAYHSKNGIHFRHSMTTYKAGEQDFVQLEAHYMCEVFLLLSGSVNYIIENICYKVSPMEMIIISPHEPHSLQVDTSQPYERMVLHFDLQLLPSFKDLELLRPFNDAKAFAHIIPKDIVKKFDLFAHMDNFKKICKNRDKYVDLNLVIAIMKFAKVINDVLEKNANAYTTIPNNSVPLNNISALCIQYINDNLTKNLTTASIAKALNISSSHVQHTFKKETGVTLHYYIRRQKMQLAKLLLSQGQSAQSVATTLGYDCYSTFYLTYLRYFQFPPSAPIKNQFDGLERQNEEDLSN